MVGTEGSFIDPQRPLETPAGLREFAEGSQHAPDPVEADRRDSRSINSWILRC
jgi:hypothetical protein